MSTINFVLKSSVFSLIWVFGLGSSVFSQVPKNSPQIQSWATTCSVVRGFINVADSTQLDNNSNRPTTGTDQDATGEADGRVVSLGDGGLATYTLSQPIGDRPGADFAVFENGFREQTPPQLWFLELAFVEVSSDGIHFTRFPAISNTQTEQQVPTFGQLDTANIHNLAGKYPALTGTPFDLGELEGSPDLDIFNITHIRIVDVVGSLDPQFASYDSKGNAVNDPFPTPFRTGGFDLDALAILGESTGVFPMKWSENNLNVFPNPVRAGEPFTIRMEGFSQAGLLTISSLSGQVLLSGIPVDSGMQSFSLSHPGLYLITLTSHEGVVSKRLLIH